MHAAAPLLLQVRGIFQALLHLKQSSYEFLASTAAYTYAATATAIGVPNYTQTSVPSPAQNSAVSSNASGSPNPSDQRQKSGLSTGAIVGIAVGVGISCLGLGALAVLFVWRKRQNKPAPPPAQGNTPAAGPTNPGNELGGKGITIIAEKQVWTHPPHPDQGNYNEVPQPPGPAPPGPGTGNAIPPTVNGYPEGYSYSHELPGYQDCQQPQRHNWGAAELPSPGGHMVGGQQRHELHSG